MTIAATFAKIIELVGESSGIVTATTTIPNVINESDLPLATVVVGPAEWNEHAVGFFRQVRTYTVKVFVKPVNSGLRLDDGYQATLPILYAVGDTFVRNPCLDNTVDLLGTRGDFTDSGVTILQFGEVSYHGFEVTLRVVEKTT